LVDFQDWSLGIAAIGFCKLFMIPECQLSRLTFPEVHCFVDVKLIQRMEIYFEKNLCKIIQQMASGNFKIITKVIFDTSNNYIETSARQIFLLIFFNLKLKT
jgi:hypothetical protein